MSDNNEDVDTSESTNQHISDIDELEEYIENYLDDQDIGPSSPVEDIGISYRVTIRRLSDGEEQDKRVIENT